MSTSQSKSAANNLVAVKEAQTGSQIQGRLDAIEGRRLFGWVWDIAHPNERLLVCILIEGRMGM